LFGLDIASTAVKAVELDRHRRRTRLRGWAVEPLPEEAVSDQAVTDTQAVAEAIARVRKALGTRRRHVAISVAGAAVITKQITIPAGLDEMEQQGQVEMEADQHLPAGIESMYLDFQPLGPVPGDEANSVEVLLVACKRDVVDSHLRALDAAGLTASVVDVDPFAVENAFERTAPEGYQERTVALLNIGAQLANINILHQGQSIFTRDHYFAGGQLAESLASEYGLSADEAERQIMRGNLPEGYRERVLEPFLENLAAEMGRSLDFYAANHPREPVDWVVLSGGCALLPGIEEVLSEQLGVPATVLDPSQGLELGKAVDGAELERVAPRLAVPTGLALRTFDP
jgi:type IV pilus assembly protein PilM